MAVLYVVESMEALGVRYVGGSYVAGQLGIVSEALLVSVARFSRMQVGLFVYLSELDSVGEVVFAFPRFSLLGLRLVSYFLAL